MTQNINKGFHYYLNVPTVLMVAWKSLRLTIMTTRETWYRPVPRAIFQDITQRAYFIRLTRRS